MRSLLGSWLVVPGVIVFEGLMVTYWSSPAMSAFPTQQTSVIVASSPHSVTENFLPQVVPIGAKLRINNQILLLEIARTAQEKGTGLMYRSSLDDNRGMLFPFSEAGQVAFWMKNVKIDLDIIFIYKGKVDSIAGGVPPCTRNPCPRYRPQILADQVLELRGGRAYELGIKVGDTLDIEYFPTCAAKPSVKR